MHEEGDDEYSFCWFIFMYTCRLVVQNVISPLVLCLEKIVLGFEVVKMTFEVSFTMVLLKLLVNYE